MIIPTMIIMILTIRIEPFPIPLLPREKHLPGSGHRTPSTDGDADDADGEVVVDGRSTRAGACNLGWPIALSILNL